jgi:hypothetical protein
MVLRMIAFNLVCNTTGLWQFPPPPSNRDVEQGERAM